MIAFNFFPVNPTVELFLEHLNKSADALEDYGISVGKVTTYF